MNSTSTSNRLVGIIVFLFTLLILGAIAYTLGFLNPILERFFMGNPPNTPVAQATTAAVTTTAPATATETLPPSQTATAVPDSPDPTPTPLPALKELPAINLEKASPSACDIDFAAITQTQAEVEDAPGGYHIIKPGESLSKIAKDVYGSTAAKYYVAIFEETNKRAAEGETAPNGANYITINRIDLISPNNVLYLPDVDKVAQIQADQTSRLNPNDPFDSNGDDNIIMVGSSTVYPIMKQMADCYKKDGFKGTIQIASTGSLGGLANVCVPDSNFDILNASISIDDSEFQKVNEEYGLMCDLSPSDLVEIQIGYDAVAVVISDQNPYREALLAMFDESQNDTALLQQLLKGANNWEELFPDHSEKGPITRYYPGETSGTLTYTAEKLFPTVKNALADDNVTNLAETCNGVALQRENDEQIAECIAQDRFGIGFVPYETYTNGANVMLLPVNGVPNPENIELDDPYELFREVYIYLPKEKLNNSKALRDFTNYVLRNVNDFAISQDLFPLSTLGSDDPNRTTDLDRAIDSYCAAVGELCSP